MLLLSFVRKRKKGSTRLNRVITKYKLRNESQSAYSKGLDTVRIGLSKTIIADYARHNYLTIAINDLDASPAFDMISANGQRLTSQQNGMHMKATKILQTVIRKARRKISTKYDISKETYTSTETAKIN